MKKRAEHTAMEQEKSRTLSLSVKEGSYTSVMSGLTSDFITPLALTLKANNAQIGFLSSFTGLISPLGQLLGSKLMEKYSRKKIITIFVAIQAMMWLPLALLPLLFWKGLFLSWLPYLLIIFYTIYAVLGGIAGPAWFSLMGDIVPEKIRGKYFGNRSKICGTIALIIALASAFFLDYFKTHGLILLGFSILFSLATIFRLISANLFTKHYDPEFKLKEGYYFSIFQFIKKAPFNNYGRFVIFNALFYIGVMIASPFFAVYMLKNLGFSFSTYMIINISAAIASLLFLPIWGKFADRFGNRELLKIGSILVGLMPILWVVSPNPIYIILVPQLISGIGWAAFNLGASNFIYDAVSRERRALCVAYYNIVVGVGVFIGASLGGLLAQYLSISFMNQLVFLFLLSGIVRLLIPLFMLPLIKEVRCVQQLKQNILYYLKEIRPVSGVTSEVVHDFKTIEKDIVCDIKKVKGELRI